jgi:hypothetical protein
VSSEAVKVFEKGGACLRGGNRPVVVGNTCGHAMGDVKEDAFDQVGMLDKGQCVMVSIFHLIRSVLSL